MKPRNLILTAICCLGICGAAQAINPLTQAMLDGYETLLQQNPNDYLTLYERASQYYRLDDYDKALSDIKRAISNTPAKEKDQLASEYSLLADIYTQTEQYSEALTAVNQALVFTPASYRLLYMKGNICLHEGDTEAAKIAFNSMRNSNSRSTEAIFGLARAAAMEGKKDEAINLLADAEKMDPSNYLTYCRMGDIHKELGMPQNAAADYLSAFSLNSGSERPISSIIALAKENYNAVDEAIDYALQKTPNVVPLYFLQGNAALAAGKYDDAYNAYRELISTVPQEEAQSLYADLSEICLRRGDIAEADTYASKAIMHKSDLKTNIIKAAIEQIRGNYPAALTYAKYALAFNPNDKDALMKAAEVAYNLQDNNSAVGYLNQVIMNDAEAADALLFRGYLQANLLGNKQAGMSDFQRVAHLTAGSPREITYKAIAQIKAGQSLDAAATIAPVEAAAEQDAEAAFLMALYNRACEKNSMADDMLDRALNLGFEDQYSLRYNTIPLMSVNNKSKN
ncbi:MAG: tetratricopeptide repeat protein [Ruminococcus sp.]|nr:tetratricopeptide repeat protein [Ruminococcus sp.]